MFVQLTELERKYSQESKECRWFDLRVLWVNPDNVTSVESYEDGVALLKFNISEQGRQVGALVRGTAANVAASLEGADRLSVP